MKERVEEERGGSPFSELDLFVHGLCWIHAEWTIAKLVGFTDKKSCASNRVVRNVERVFQTY